MSISERTKHILDGIDSRIPDHPLKATVKNSIINALSAAEKFAAKKAELERSETLTPRGRHQALLDSLVNQYGKDLVRARAPIAKARKEIESRRSALVIKEADPANLAAALERQEIRTWLRSLDLGQRQTMLATTTDRRILEAALAAPPELSGIAGNLAHLADQIEERFVEMIHGPEIASIKFTEALLDEGEAGLGVARVLTQGVTELNDREFESLMRPVEIRPWLMRSPGDDAVRVVEVSPDGKSATYRRADENDIANGVYYRSNAEYFAAQGMADRAA
jgi:hypothetical protein